MTAVASTTTDRLRGQLAALSFTSLAAYWLPDLPVGTASTAAAGVLAVCATAAAVAALHAWVRGGTGVAVWRREPRTREGRSSYIWLRPPGQAT